LTARTGSWREGSVESPFTRWRRPGAASTRATRFLGSGRMAAARWRWSSWLGRSTGGRTPARGAAAAGWPCGSAARGAGGRHRSFLRAQGLLSAAPESSSQEADAEPTGPAQPRPRQETDAVARQRGLRRGDERASALVGGSPARRLHRRLRLDERAVGRALRQCRHRGGPALRRLIHRCRSAGFHPPVPHLAMHGGASVADYLPRPPRARRCAAARARLQRRAGRGVVSASAGGGRAAPVCQWQPVVRGRAPARWLCARARTARRASRRRGGPRCPRVGAPAPRTRVAAVGRRGKRPPPPWRRRQAVLRPEQAWRWGRWI
jgi:hypothetical protein